MLLLQAVVGSMRNRNNSRSSGHGCRIVPCLQCEAESPTGRAWTTEAEFDTIGKNSPHTLGKKCVCTVYLKLLYPVPLKP